MPTMSTQLSGEVLARTLKSKNEAFDALGTMSNRLGIMSTSKAVSELFANHKTATEIVIFARRDIRDGKTEKAVKSLEIAYKVFEGIKEKAPKVTK